MHTGTHTGTPTKSEGRLPPGDPSPRSDFKLCLGSERTEIMARKKPKQRAAVGALGKLLTRRSKGRCELCMGTTDVRPYELAPFPEEPDPERTLMACSRCR